MNAISFVAPTVTPTFINTTCFNGEISLITSHSYADSPNEPLLRALFLDLFKRIHSIGCVSCSSEISKRSWAVIVRIVYSFGPESCNRSSSSGRTRSDWDKRVWCEISPKGKFLSVSELLQLTPPPLLSIGHRTLHPTSYLPVIEPCQTGSTSKSFILAESFEVDDLKMLLVKQRL